MEPPLVAMEKVVGGDSRVEKMVSPNVVGDNPTPNEAYGHGRPHRKGKEVCTTQGEDEAVVNEGMSASVGYGQQVQAHTIVTHRERNFRSTSRPPTGRGRSVVRRNNHPPSYANVVPGPSRSPQEVKSHGGVKAPQGDRQSSNPKGAPTKSWANVARANAAFGYELPFVKPISRDGMEGMHLSEDVKEATDKRWFETIVGYFVGRKLAYTGIYKSLKEMWGNYLVDMFTNDDGFYFFHIPDPDFRRKIIERGPIPISRVPLFLQQWRPSLVLKKEKHDKIPMWVKLRNLPLVAWSPLGIGGVASVIGRPLYVDQHTEKMRMISFARVCIEVSAKTTLPDKVPIFSDDETIYVDVEYEWRPARCDKCLIFGHQCVEPKVAKEGPNVNLKGPNGSVSASSQVHNSAAPPQPVLQPKGHPPLLSASPGLSAIQVGALGQEECLVPLQGSPLAQKVLSVQALMPLGAAPSLSTSPQVGILSALQGDTTGQGVGSVQQLGGGSSRPVSPLAGGIAREAQIEDPS